uniref:Homeobox protein 2-like n=1 Tax=Parastrongyloides trichosuri TaxID=131310 RepID=A0A0N4ZAZ1_PARTI
MNSIAACLANDIEILHVSHNQHGGSNYHPNNSDIKFVEHQNNLGNSIHHNNWNSSTSIHRIPERYENETYTNGEYLYSQRNNMRHSQFIPCCYSSYINLTHFDRVNGNYHLSNHHMYHGNGSDLSKHPYMGQGIYYPQQLAYQNNKSNSNMDNSFFKLNRFSSNNNNLKNSSNSRSMTRPASIAALSNSSFSFLSSQDISSQKAEININIPKNSSYTKEEPRIHNSEYNHNLKSVKSMQHINNTDNIPIPSVESNVIKPNITMRKKPNSNGSAKEKIKKDRTHSWRVSRFLPSKIANSFSNSMYCKFILKFLTGGLYHCVLFF